YVSVCSIKLFVIFRYLFYCLLTRRLPASTLFPYTTRFRSLALMDKVAFSEEVAIIPHEAWVNRAMEGNPNLKTPRNSAVYQALRSEEHTSELQSRENLVCRLLLEKKKNKFTS